MKLILADHWKNPKFLGVRTCNKLFHGGAAARRNRSFIAMSHFLFQEWGDGN